jgi:crossover junction endodeoxyribonuclease RuvC
MIILGIDPGTSSIGYSIFETGITPRLLHAGVFRLQKVAPDERLLALHTGVKKLISKWQPQTLAIERLFFAKNTKTALSVSESRGALLLTAALAGIRVFEYTPLEIKKTVTGNGSAEKAAVEKMIRLTLPDTATIKTQDDTFDAIAVAYTCYLK